MIKRRSKPSHLWSYNPETQDDRICSQDGGSTVSRDGGGGEDEGQTQRRGGEESEQKKNTQDRQDYSITVVTEVFSPF